MMRDMTNTHHDVEERHPSFGVARVNTVSSTGCHLFDSELKHSKYVVLTVRRAVRTRKLNQDWIREDFGPAENRIVEVSMSMAQWGALVSSFGDGNGVPVTIDEVCGEDQEATPFEPRLAISANEVRNSGVRMTEQIKAAFREVEAAFNGGAGKKDLREKLNTLRHMIDNTPANMRFAAESLTEHVENVVTKARADVEAMVTQAAARQGIEAPKVYLELEAGE